MVLPHLGICPARRGLGGVAEIGMTPLAGGCGPIDEESAEDVTIVKGPEQILESLELGRRVHRLPHQSRYDLRRIAHAAAPPPERVECHRVTLVTHGSKAQADQLARGDGIVPDALEDIGPGCTAPPEEFSEATSQSSDVRVEQLLRQTQPGAGPKRPKACPKPALSPSRRGRALRGPDLHRYVEITTETRQACDVFEPGEASPGSPSAGLAGENADGDAQSPCRDAQGVNGFLIPRESSGEGTAEVAHGLAEQRQRGTGLLGVGRLFAHGAPVRVEKA